MVEVVEVMAAAVAIRKRRKKEKNVATTININIKLNMATRNPKKERMGIHKCMIVNSTRNLKSLVCGTHIKSRLKEIISTHTELVANKIPLRDEPDMFQHS